MIPHFIKFLNQLKNSPEDINLQTRERACDLWRQQFILSFIINSCFNLYMDPFYRNVDVRTSYAFNPLG